MATQRIIGTSATWLTTLDHVSRLAPVNRPVLVLGERGTGKELIAERLHFLSLRWDKPLVKVNCASFSESLLESELFGYEPGAFTGALKRHQGRFERAQGGTLLLDELATLSARVQEKILRVIEYGEFERVGGQETLTADVRILGSTNADLQAMAVRGEFRADLLDRLAFDIVALPALRQRPEDILELASHFAVRMSHELGWSLFAGFTANASQTLLDYHWPGNVRELKNVVERSVYRSDGEDSTIDQIVINPFAVSVPPDVAPEVAPTPDTLAAPETPDILDTPDTSVPLGDFSAAVNALEQQLLNRALAATDHHQGRAADALGLTYNQFRGLYRKHKPGKTA